MQSTIDVSTAVCESAGIKRAASPCLSSSAEYHQPLPQHEFPCPTDQVCYSKRLRTFDSIPSLKTQKTHTTSTRAPPSIVWRDFRNQEAKIAEEAQSPNHGALDPRDQTGDYFKPHGSLHNFFTKASIETPRGVVDLERVQVDERNPFNLVPWSIATNLDLMLYSGETLAITIAHHLIQTNHYSQIAIRVAGHNTTINTGVVSGLQTILLGREWIRCVHLLSFGNQKYYIPIPLAIEVAEEKFPDIVNTEAEAKDVEPVDMATSDEIAEERDDDEFRNADGGDDHSNGQSSLDNSSFLESELAFDGQNLLDGDTISDEPSSGDDTLSDDRTSSEGSISGKHEVTPIDYEDDSEHDHGECEGCEECDGLMNVRDVRTARVIRNMKSLGRGRKILMTTYKMPEMKILAQEAMLHSKQLDRLAHCIIAELFPETQRENMEFLLPLVAATLEIFVTTCKIGLSIDRPETDLVELLLSFVLLVLGSLLSVFSIIQDEIAIVEILSLNHGALIIYQVSFLSGFASVY